MGKARIKISLDLLAESLLLPKGTEIIYIGQDFTDQTQRIFQILVENSDLPETLKGAMYPAINPIYHNRYYEDCKHSITEFKSWNLENSINTSE